MMNGFEDDGVDETFGSGENTRVRVGMSAFRACVEGCVCENLCLENHFLYLFLCV
jgi:hypothetical protein